MNKLFNVFLFCLGLVLLTAGCKKDEEPTTPTPPTPTPTVGITGPDVNISFASGAGATSRVITGGTLPYTMTIAPTGAVATATLSNDTLTIVPVAAGTDSLEITDSTPGPGDFPAYSVIIHITVAGGGGSKLGGSGSMSFTGTFTFSANGAYDPNATSGSFCAGIRTDTTNYYALILYGFVFNSATSASINTLLFYSPNPLTTGSYPLVPGGGAYCSIGYAHNVDPNNIDPNDVYVLTSGTSSITTLTSSNAQGAFSGSGANGQNPPATIDKTGGAYNINYITGQPAMPGQTEIENIVKRVAAIVREKSLAK